MKDMTIELENVFGSIKNRTCNGSGTQKEGTHGAVKNEE
jgi:hypothetical protein